ncbi:sodium:solute symporter family protein [Wenyingzhuangia aestuarii]|uniref:sodium:solute symporter family protein n=1 Tax=Wenyingzhuangia aestuarii TaxID=1647582 RepID=UPI00143B383B|nr:sodium:solute symporter family protein [Wenyingzhuangia aestuarii]NJB81666.1 SSS family transporter [Wenyingzhuangia aestuarii]
MSNIDIGVIILFSILVFVCGLSFSKSGKNMKSYFAAGGGLPWWMSGLSLFMSFFSAGTFVVWGAIAYSSGWVAVTIQWTMCIAGIIIAFFIAPKWQKTKALTAAEYITSRLGFKTQKVYTYLFLVISIFTTGTYLYPVAKIVEVSTNIPISTSIIFLGVIILIYTAVGGLWAVIVTDILQFVVLTAAVLIVVPLALDKVGGIDGFISKAPENYFNLVNAEYSWEFMVAFGLYNLFFIAGHWGYIQRYTSVSSPKEAKKVGLVFASLYTISPIIWMLPPMIYKVLNPELGALADEGAYLLICKEVLPIGMLGLMLGGMVFATSSSVNTTLNISAGVFTNDIYRHLKPNTSDANLVKIGKSTTIVLGIITIIIALLVPMMGGIVSVVLTLAALTGGAMFLPPLWSLFSKQQTGNSVIMVTITSLIINLFFKFAAPELFEIYLSRANEMILGVGGPIVLLAIYEVYAKVKKLEPTQYNQYVAKMNAKPVSNTTDDSNSQNLKGVKVIGIGIFCTGLIIVGLTFLSETSSAIITSIGSLVLLGGGYIVFKSIKNNK